MATLRVHMAGGTARLRGLDEDVLAELFEVESRHAAVSRRLTMSTGRPVSEASASRSIPAPPELSPK